MQRSGVRIRSRLRPLNVNPTSTVGKLKIIRVTEPGSLNPDELTWSDGVGHDGTNHWSRCRRIDGDRENLTKPTFNVDCNLTWTGLKLSRNDNPQNLPTMLDIRLDKRATWYRLKVILSPLGELHTNTLTQVGSQSIAFEADLRTRRCRCRDPNQIGGFAPSRCCPLGSSERSQTRRHK